MSAKTHTLDADLRNAWHGVPLYSALQRSNRWYACGYSLWEARRTGKIYRRTINSVGVR